MRNEEDEAFDELAKRQGDWGGGFPAKRKMAADKLGQLLADNNMPDTPTARAVYRKMSERVEDDDDIQDYKKPWVDLSDSQIEQVYFDFVKRHRGAAMPWAQIQFGKVLQAFIKEKNG
jgi:hypothetical protein